MFYFPRIQNQRDLLVQILGILYNIEETVPLKYDHEICCQFIPYTIKVDESLGFIEGLKYS
jgi:hypothetical protein